MDILKEVRLGLVVLSMALPKLAQLALMKPQVFNLQQHVVDVEVGTSLSLRLSPQGRSQCIFLLLAEVSNEHHAQLYNNQAPNVL
jgi:hypothetical protein